MIKNARQYRVTRAQLRLLENGLAEAHDAPGPDDLRKVHVAALRSEIAVLQRDLRRYDALHGLARAAVRRSAARSDAIVGALVTVPGIGQNLIEARIASRLSQKALADRLGKHEQAIQRYEAENYASASLRTLTAVAAAIRSAAPAGGASSRRDRAKPKSGLAA